MRVSYTQIIPTNVRWPTMTSNIKTHLKLKKTKTTSSLFAGLLTSSRCQCPRPARGCDWALAVVLSSDQDPGPCGWDLRGENHFESRHARRCSVHAGLINSPVDSQRGGRGGLGLSNVSRSQAWARGERRGDQGLCPLPSFAEVGGEAVWCIASIYFNICFYFVFQFILFVFLFLFFHFLKMIIDPVLRCLLSWLFFFNQTGINRQLWPLKNNDSKVLLFCTFLNRKQSWWRETMRLWGA